VTGIVGPQTIKNVLKLRWEMNYKQFIEVFTLPRLIHVESMESIMAESSANLLFHGHHGFHMEGSWNGHGMVNSIWIPLIPYGIWAYPPWIPWNKSRWIPWNSTEIPYGKHQLSEIASAWRIEPSTP